MKTMIVAATIALIPASQAHAVDCGPNIKSVRLESYGFVPDLQYFCVGQKVIVTNQSGSYLNFDYKDWLGRVVSYTNLRSGSSLEFTYATKFYNVKTTGRNWRYLNSGEIKFGLATDKYADSTVN